MRRIAIVAGLPVLLAGCFEIRPPIIEQMTLDFGADEEVKAMITTDLDPDPATGAPAERVSDYQARVEAADDPWRASTLAAEPETERYTLTRERGELRGIERELVLDKPMKVAELFIGDAVRAGFVADGATRSFSLTPVGTLADGAEVEYVEKRRLELVQRARRYLEATVVLYRMVESHPERRRAIMGFVYGEEILSAAEAEALAVLLDFGSDAEVAARTEYEAAIGELGGFLYDLPKDGPMTGLQYVSRRVLHPLRASLEVQVSGEVRAYAGFVPIGDDGRRFELPEISFAGAVTDVARAIVDPLPLATLIERLDTDDETKIPLDDLANQEILVRPVPADLDARLAAALQPAPQYSIEWRVDPRAAAAVGQPHK